MSPKEHLDRMALDDFATRWSSVYPTLDHTPPQVYAHVSQGQLSLARYSNAAMLHDQRYTYLPAADVLVRPDLYRVLIAQLKAAQQKPAPKAIDETGALF